VVELFRETWHVAVCWLGEAAALVQDSLLRVVRHGEAMSHRQLAFWLAMIVLCYVCWHTFGPADRR
jgi:hypothetical protein